MKKAQAKKIQARKQKIKDQKLSRQQQQVQNRREQKLEYLINKKFRERQIPYRYDQDAVLARDERIKEKLARNAEILQALSDELEAEEKQRQELNENLEKQGHYSIEDKLNALSTQVDVNSASQPVVEEQV